ncbi:mycothiol synthase [Nocardioides insulae]|uniref:mycothiol synthase n=1 Tax=Nocardioides insulae TaxID=394734 RepID=UPI00040840C1|nr:mycothiol synthase [Nocardioides insulae]
MDHIAEIARAAEHYDGAAPLDEATVLALRHRPDSARVWGDPDGVAVLLGDELSLVTRPSARGHGLGGRLLEEALTEISGPIRAWSHGDHPAAAALAARYRFRRTRELWVMRRPVTEDLEAPSAPEGVSLHGYTSSWESELLRVNAAAFADHPEQGALDGPGLAERMGEPWWDAAGLILATEEDRLLGFHWTKRHSSRLGEVYVVGVDPSSQGRGLGRILTSAGLAHLADLGVAEIHLYVESDNTPAIRLYTGLDFTHAPADTHVQYARD